LESSTAIPSTLSSNPAAVVNVFPPAVPPSVVLPGLPSLRITAVGGQGVPNPPRGQFGPTDVTLTAPGTSTVELAASGIPLGTTIQVTVKPEASTMPSTTYTSTPLSGALESSTATASVNFPALNSYYLEARATYTPLGAGAGETMNINGEKIKQIRVETAQGAESKLTYILESGKEVPFEKAGFLPSPRKQSRKSANR
jgi:hypothetical protein